MSIVTLGPACSVELLRTTNKLLLHPEGHLLLTGMPDKVKMYNILLVRVAGMSD